MTNNFNNLIHKALKEYVTYLEEELQVPIKLVSIGPDRVQTIMR